MDQLTHTVRRSNWINIIRQCQDRPAGTTAKKSFFSSVYGVAKVTILVTNTELRAPSWIEYLLSRNK